MSKQRQALIATIYSKRGRILSRGVNSYHKSHPLQHRFACAAGRPAAIFLHAEIHALTRLKDWSCAHRIVIERYSKNGDPLLAKPCEICILAIQEAGIEHIEYTEYA
jgi:tRNA(Arg) A34 adenosine deaminase TadA